jgi:hypothetical protein
MLEEVGFEGERVRIMILFKIENVYVGGCWF